MSIERYAMAVRLKDEKKDFYLNNNFKKLYKNASKQAK